MFCWIKELVKKKKKNKLKDHNLESVPEIIGTENVKWLLYPYY